jgi:predicted permease
MTSPLEWVRQDLRLALRSLGRSPGFVITAIVSLGLGMGAAAAAFGVIDAVRFRTLPFPDADRLVVLSEVPAARTGTQPCRGNCPVAYETYDQVLRTYPFRSVDAIIAFTGGGKALNTGDQSVILTGGILSPNAFGVLDVAPLRGRVFTEEDNRLGVPLVTVLGHAMWLTHFGGDPSVLGRLIKLSDSQYTVIGIMPPGFEFEVGSDFWLPVVPTLDPSTRPSIRSLNVAARLAPGHTLEELRAELSTIRPGLPAANGQPAVETALDAQPLRVRYAAATRSHDIVFASIVGCVLLIACLNLANLVLVRTLGQQRELATRAALGAGAARLLRYLFTQNAILVLGAALLAIVIALQLMSALGSLAFLGSLRPRGMEYRLDARVFAFTVLLALLAVTVLSLVPARLIGRIDPQQVLRDAAPTTSGGRSSRHAQRVFVVVQIASAVVLLTGAGLLVRTAFRLSRVMLGFDAANVFQASPSLPHPWRVEETYVPLFARILTEAAQLPGVEATALRAGVPLGGRGTDVEVLPEGATTPLPAALLPQSVSSISADYFTTLGIRVLEGRAFSAADVAGAPPAVILNQWAAERWFPGGHSVGRTVRVTVERTPPLTLTVTGVIANNRAAQPGVLFAGDGPEMYRPFDQARSAFPSFFVRSRAPATIASPVRVLMLQRVPDRPLFTGLLADGIANQLGGVRTNALQILGFALVGLLLAITGLYGVISYAVGRKIREFAIRGALGATRRDIRSLVLRDAVRLTAIGVLAGLPAAALASRLIRDLLYGTSTMDAAVYGVVALSVGLIALLASWIPARRAVRIEPNAALRIT